MVRLEISFPKQFYCCGSQCCLKCVRLGCDAVSASMVLSLSCLGSCLPVSQLVFQPGMLCPAPWSCLCLVSGLVSQLVSQSASLFFSLGCCVRLPGLVSALVSQSASLFPKQFTVGFSLGCGVCGPGLSHEFYVRFVQLFGVYGGVILYETHPKQRVDFKSKNEVNCILFI